MRDPFRGEWTVTDSHRYRSFCRIWKGSRKWRTCIVTDRLQLYRHHVVQHRPCLGRIGSLVPCGWIVLSLLYAFPRPGMGLRHGMELLFAMADCSAARDSCRCNYGQILAVVHFTRGMGCGLLVFDHRHKLLWSPCVWRSGVCLLHHQSDCGHWLYVRFPAPAL